MSGVDLVPTETAQLDPETKSERPLGGVVYDEKPYPGRPRGVLPEDGSGLGSRAPAYFMAAAAGKKERW